MSSEKRTKPTLAEAPAPVVEDHRRVASYGLSKAAVAALRERLGAGLVETDDLDSALETVRAETMLRVLCLAVDRPTQEFAAKLETAFAELDRPPLVILLGVGEDSSPLQSLVDNDHIFYLTARPPSAEPIARVVAAALDSTEKPRVSPLSDDFFHLVRDIGRQERFDRVPHLVERAILFLTRADQASCRFVEQETHTLWRQDESGQKSGDSAASGLAAYVARTGETVRVERASDDPRHDPDADTAGDAGAMSFLAAAAHGAGATPPPIVAVLTASRTSDAPFTPDDQTILEDLAFQVGPVLERALDARQQEETLWSSGIYRADAMREHLQGVEANSQPLRVAPRWLGGLYRSLVLLAGAGLLAASFARTTEVATGVARARGGTLHEVRVEALGEVETVAKAVGEPVEADEALAVLDVAGGSPEVVRSPVAGTVVERILAAGDPAVPGQIAAIVAAAGSDEADGTDHLLIAFPAEDRGLLSRGAEATLILEDGARHAVRLDALGDSPVSATRARRLWGASEESEELFAAPQVLARATAPPGILNAASRGRVEVEVGSKPLLSVLLPFLGDR